MSELVITGGGRRPLVGILRLRDSVKLRAHNQSISMLTGDVIEYIFPCYGTTRDEEVTTPDPIPDNYRMTGLVRDVEVSVIINNIVADKFYKVNVSIEFWDTKTLSYKSLVKGTVTAIYEDGTWRIPSIISGNVGVLLTKDKIPVFRNSSSDHRAKIVISNEGDDVDIDLVASINVIDIKEVGI